MPARAQVSLALFAAGGLGNNDAGMGICIGPGLAIPAEGTDERGINCELLPMPQGQPVADNLDAPGVLHGHIQVHISQAHIPGHTCASLAAHPGECALKGDGARGKDSKPMCLRDARKKQTNAQLSACKGLSRAILRMGR